MTIYIIDLSKPDSVSRLQSTQKIAGLCTHMCTKLMVYLSDILMTSSQPDKQNILKYITITKWYLNLLGNVPFDEKGIPFEINVHHIYLERYTDGRGNTHRNQVITMDTLSSIPPVIIVEFISEIIESALICLHPILIPLARYEVIVDKLTGIICNLHEIFPYREITPHNLANTIVKFEVIDQINEINNYVS
jgi:hypothetical protein